MKKSLLLIMALFLILGLTGCGSSASKSEKASSKKTYEELLEIYAEGFQEKNINKMMKVFPNFAAKVMKEYMSEEDFEYFEETYGADYKLTFDVIGTKKMDDSWLEKNERNVKKIYNTEVELKECYEIEGTMTYKGSKSEDTEDIGQLYYCNIDEEWYLLGT